MKVHRDSAAFAKQLAEVLQLHPSGVLVWKARPRTHFKTQRAYSMWNTRYSGAEAGRVDALGYIAIHIIISGTRQMLKGHHIAWAIHTGMWPTKELDHINGERGDNRIENLREASRTQNCQNRTKRRDTVCRSKGVTFNKGKFQARIQINGVPKHLGTFTTEGEAAQAYQIKSKELFGAFHKEQV